MRKYLISCILYLGILFSALYAIPYTLYPVFAHLPGQPPFFKVNGTYTDYYPVPSSSIAEFNLPQDIAPNLYLINEPINFELDIAVLPVVPEIVNQTRFVWDFGDGTKATGLKNTHSYKKMGSYIITVTAQYGADQPQLLQSTFINIVPTLDYELPKAIIEVDGKQSKDPLTDILNLDFKKEITFDASKSFSKNSKITSFYWDFGDVGFSNEKITTHKYDPELYQVFPVLRITDDQGFMADSFIEIKNTQKNPNLLEQVKEQTENNTSQDKIIPGIILTAIILGGIFFFTKLRKKK